MKLLDGAERITLFALGIVFGVAMSSPGHPRQGFWMIVTLALLAWNLVLRRVRYAVRRAS